MTFVIKQNDTFPKLNATLKDANDTVVNLATSVDSAGTIVGNASDGKVRNYWSASDTAAIGTYIGEFEVTYADTTVETFPNNGFFQIEVADELA